MLNPFRKKRIIKKIYREQKRMLDEELEYASDGKITPDEIEHLHRHAEVIKLQLKKLFPRQPLDWVSVMVRIGVASILFIILALPSYTVIHNQLIEPQVTTSTSISGKVVITNYVAATPAGMEPRQWRKSGPGAKAELASSTSMEGMTVGIIPNTFETSKGERQGVSIFSLEKVENRRVIQRIDTDDFFRKTRTTSTVFWNDKNFINAAATASGTESVLVATYREKAGGAVSMQKFGPNGRPSTPRVELALDVQNESPDDVHISPWGEYWALVTRVPRVATNSAFDPTRVVVRLLDSELRSTTTTFLEISGYEIGPSPQLVANRRGSTGFTLVASARPLIRTAREVKGNDLFAFIFNTDRELTRMIKLTNNGLEHDYGTTGFTIGLRDYYILGALNIPSGSLEDKENPYAFGSGRAYLRFFNHLFDISGTIIVFDDIPLKNQADNIGVANIHHVYVGDQLYVVYDTINGDSSITDTPVRTITAMSMRINQR